jgi:hypothetical protein
MNKPTFLSDPDFDFKMDELSKYLKEQQKKLLATIDWSQDSDYEFSPEFIFGEQ